MSKRVKTEENLIYQKALADYHNKTHRHVLVLEANVTEDQKRKILHASNLVRIAGNDLTAVMKNNYEQLTRTKKYCSLKSLYKKAKDDDDEKKLKNVVSQMQRMQKTYNVTWDFCRKSMEQIKDRYKINSIKSSRVPRP